MPPFANGYLDWTDWNECWKIPKRDSFIWVCSPCPAEKDPIHEHHVRGLELKLLYAGPRALTTSEKSELLLSADSFRRLRPEPAKEVTAQGVGQPAVSV